MPGQMHHHSIKMVKQLSVIKTAFKIIEGFFFHNKFNAGFTI